jgi:hypothetical protein
MTDRRASSGAATRAKRRLALTGLVSPVLIWLAVFFAHVVTQPTVRMAYFDAVAQIVPIVILALAIELRYFSPLNPSRGLASWIGDDRETLLLFRMYPQPMFLMLVLAEVASLWTLASGRAGEFAIDASAAGLAGGAAALVTSILIPAGRFTD